MIVFCVACLSKTLHATDNSGLSKNNNNKLFVLTLVPTVYGNNDGGIFEYLTSGKGSTDLLKLPTESLLGV